MLRGLASRLALRDLARHKGRSLLIVLLLALPIAGLSLFSSFASPTMDEEGNLAAEFGGAPAVLVRLGNADGSCHQQTLADTVCSEAGDPLKNPAPLTSAQVPGGLGRVTSSRVAPLVWRDTVQSATVLVIDVPAAVASEQMLVAGKTEPGPGEVILVARRGELLGYGIGDRVNLAGAEQTVVGVARVRAMVSDYWFVVGPTSPLALGAEPIRVELDRVPDQATVTQLNQQGIAVLSRDAVLKAFRESNPQGRDTAMLAIMLGLAALVLMVTGTVASSAFAIGFRQQRRSLALLSATGAPPRMLGAIVRRQGLFLGLIAAVVAAGLGALGSWGLLTLWERRSPDYPLAAGVDWLTLAVLAAAVVVASVLAAWIPARQVSATDVMTAVRSAESAATPARRPWLGVGLAVVGLVVGLLGALQTGSLEGFRRVEKGVIPAVASVVLLFFAALVSLGWILQGLGALSGKGPLGLRLAARDWSRNRQRAAATVAATMAMMTLVSTALITMDSVGRTAAADYRPSHAEKLVSITSYGQLDPKNVTRVTSRVIEVLGPPREQMEVKTPVSNDEQLVPVVAVELNPCADDSTRLCAGYSGDPVLGDEALVSFFSGSPASAAASEILAQGGVVAFGPIVDGAVEVTAGAQTAKVPAVQVGNSMAPPVFGQALLDRFGIKDVTFTTSNWLRYDQRPTAEQQTQLQSVGMEILDLPLVIGYETGPDTTFEQGVSYSALVLGTLMVMIAVITTSLALRDGRRTMEVMAGVGASTWTLRAMTAVSAIATTALGVVLGLLVGMLPLVAVILATRGYVLLAIPWLHLAILVVGVPLLLGLVGWLLPPAKARVIRAD